MLTREVTAPRRPYVPVVLLASALSAALSGFVMFAMRGPTMPAIAEVATETLHIGYHVYEGNGPGRFRDIEIHDGTMTMNLATTSSINWHTHNLTFADQ